MLILGRRLCAYICQGSTSMRASQGLSAKASIGSRPAAPKAPCWRSASDRVWHANHQWLLRGPGVPDLAWKSKNRAAQRSKELMLCAEIQHLPSRKHWRGRDTNCQEIARSYSFLVPPQSLRQSRELDGGCPYHAAPFFSPQFIKKPTREPGRGERASSSCSTGTQCQYTKLEDKTH